MNLICNYPFTHFEVNNPNGDVTFCCNHNLILGNVNNSSIAEIWNGEKYQEVRKKFLEGKIFEICSRECPVLKGWKDYEKLDWFKDIPSNSEAYKNALQNEDEIFEGRFLLDSKPRWIRFATSYKCNLKCYHCFQDVNTKKIDVLPKKFFDDIKENHLKYMQIIFFYGGEPFVEKSNIELLKFISEKNFLLKILIITNGTVLNDEIKTILEKVNLGVLSVSVDSIKKELYEKLRFPAKFEIIENNLKYFSDLILKKKGEYHLGTTINKKNFNEILEYIEYSIKLKAIPLFQMASNTFNNKNFRNEYEIFYPREFKLLKIELEKSIEVLKKNVEVTEYTLRNLQHLSDYSSNKMIENRMRNRIIKFLKRKKKIYFDKLHSILFKE